MEQPVQTIKQDFLIQLQSILRQAILRHGRTDHNLAVRKGNDIRLGWVAEKIAVDPSHGCSVDQDKLDLCEFRRERTRQERQRRVKPLQKQTGPHYCFALLV